jgi:hypothetical protein
MKAELTSMKCLIRGVLNFYPSLAVYSEVQWDMVQELIKTSLRDKLSKELSYPVGAGIISSKLSGVPQYEHLWLSFNKACGTPVSAGSRRKDIDTFHRILACHFNLNYGGGMWISVYAIRGKMRKATRDALIVYGLPKLRGWLVSERQETWFRGFREFAIGIDFHSSRICLVETDNRKIVQVEIVHHDIT